MFKKSDPSANHKAANEYMPIRVLTTMSQDWVIKGRVTTKTTVKNFGGNRPGKMFSIIIIDTEGTEIEGTFFNESVDIFSDAIEQGKTYLFSGGYVKLASQQYRKVNNDYQISFDKKSHIVQTHDNGDIATVKLSLVPLSELKSLPDKRTVDVCGVLVDISEASEFTSKKGDNLVKRNLKIIDQSMAMVDLTLWGEEATNLSWNTIDLESFPVVIAAKVRISHFDGISLTTDRGISHVLVDSPDYPVIVRDLKEWKNNPHDSDIQAENLTVKNEKKSSRQLRTIKEIKEYWENADPSTKEEFYNVRAFVGFIKRDDRQSMTYESCNNKDKCKKKATLESDGLYHCNSCSKAFEKPIPRYILSLRIHDSTESAYVTAFDDTASQLLKTSAEDLMEMMAHDEMAFDNVINNAMQKEWGFVIKAQSNSNDRGGARMKLVLASVREVNKMEAADRILEEITQAIRGNN